MTEPKWNRPDLLERLAVERRALEYTDKFGIYAVPFGHDGRFYWRVRLPGGFDPDLGWMQQNQPTAEGWPTWAEAVAALGDAMEKGEVT